MRAFNFWPSSSLFFLIFCLSFAASIFIPEQGTNDDSLIFSTSIDDGSPGFDSLNFDSTLMSQSDECANDDATKSHRKRQSKPTWCPPEKPQGQQQSDQPKGQQPDGSGWTDNKPYDGELPSQLRFLDEDPHSVGDPKPNKEVCGNRGIFAVCASDQNVGWWGQPDSMQFKLDPCTPYSPGFPCLATEIIWCCQGIYMKAMEFHHYLGFVCLPKDPKHQIPLLPDGEHM